MGELLNIRNGLVTTLAACGPYFAGEISTCDLGIMDGVSGCAVMLLPGNSPFTPDRYGTPPARHYDRRWGINGKVYVKDNGDAAGFNARIWQAVEDIYTTLRKDATLNGTADDAVIVNANALGTGFDAQGVNWGVVEFEVRARLFTT